MFINTLLQAACGILWKWFLKKLMMYPEKKGIFHSTYVSIFLVSPCSYQRFFLVFQTSRNGSNQGDGWERDCRWMWCHRWERGRGQRSLLFWDLMLLSDSIDIFSELGRFSCSSILSGLCSTALFFLCCLMLINVNTACNLIPELLLTVASAEFPAGSALVWTFLKNLMSGLFFISVVDRCNTNTHTHASVHLDKVRWHHPYPQPIRTSS